MWTKVIIGYDGSDEGEDALVLARLLAAPVGAQLIAACVRPLPRFARNGADLSDGLQAQAAATLEPLAADGIDLRPLVAGSSARGLFELAEAEDAGLLVVGSSRRGGVGAVLAGSVGRSLLQGAPCPVAIAPRGYRTISTDRLRVLGVGYDATPEAEVAFDAAIELAEAAEATLRVMTVVAPAAAQAHYAVAAGAPPRPTVKESMQTSLSAAIERSPHELRALPQLLTGHPAPTLRDEADQIVDVLMLGSRGYGPLKRVMLGSVAADLMSSAPCPLLVFPRGSAPHDSGNH